MRKIVKKVGGGARGRFEEFNRSMEQLDHYIEGIG